MNYEHAITTFALNNFDYGRVSLKKSRQKLGKCPSKFSHPIMDVQKYLNFSRNVDPQSDQVYLTFLKLEQAGLGVPHSGFKLS